MIREPKILRNSIAIKIVLGLALILALLFVAAAMSFWQADAVNQKTENIVQVLEPKRTAAYEMELNSIETEMLVLEYLRRPDSALRSRVRDNSARFYGLELEYLALANPEEILQVADRLEEIALVFVNTSETLMDQADLWHTSLEALEKDLQHLSNLAFIDPNDQMALRASYGQEKLIYLQMVDTRIAEINHAIAAYLSSPKSSLRDQIAEHSREFNQAVADYNGLASNEEESQRGEQLQVSFAAADVKVSQLLDLKDRLDQNIAAFSAQRSGLNDLLRLQIQVPAQLQMNQAKEAVHSIDSQTIRVTLILLLVGLVLVFGSVLLVFQRITKPVRKLVLATERAAEGDLTARVEVVSNDEIGLLGAAFNEMISNRQEAERALLLSEEEQRRLANENAVNASIGRIVSSSLDIREVYDAFAQEVRTLVRFDWLAISILDHDLETQRIEYVSKNVVPYLGKGASLALKDTFVGAVAEHRDFIMATIDSGEYSFLGPIAEAGFHAVLGVPLFSRDRVIGALIFASNDEIPYSEGEISAARAVADQVAGAIANAQTYAERQETQSQLLRAHDELENRVLERTLELENTRDIAEEASRAKSQFLANMSHELRTPLNAVIGYSELLIEVATEEDNAASVRNLERITASGKHLLTLVNDILDLAKVEAGKMDLLIEDFDISSVVEEVCVVSETLVENNSNKLSVHCPGDIGSMRTDQVKVRQMLFNLLSNAAKFTENGEISLCVEREHRDGDDWIVFTVTDTGIGMSLDVAEKLFQPFTQADSSTARKYGGSGLGLNLCKSFSELMGGGVTLESQLGSGSTFVIQLPAAIAGPAADPIDAGILLDTDSVKAVDLEIHQGAEV